MEHTQPRLSTVVIEVPDVDTLDSCKSWYQSLGLPKMDFDEPGESYWFDAGNEILLGVHIGSSSPPQAFTLYLTVPDVDRIYDSLQTRGFKFDSAPETKFWGRYAQLRDPAGTAVRLVVPS